MGYKIRKISISKAFLTQNTTQWMFSMLLEAAKRSPVKEADAEEVIKKWQKSASDVKVGPKTKWRKKVCNILICNTCTYIKSMLT